MSETPPERPLAFVIGDSISMGYGPFLKQYLAPCFRCTSKSGGEKAMRALGLPVHGGDSSQVLKYLVSNHVHREIPATDYLLINCGLHDIRTDPASGARQIDADSYRSNLVQIVDAARVWAAPSAGSAPRRATKPYTTRARPAFIDSRPTAAPTTPSPTR